MIMFRANKTVIPIFWVLLIFGCPHVCCYISESIWPIGKLRITLERWNFKSYFDTLKFTVWCLSSEICPKRSLLIFSGQSLFQLFTCGRHVKERVEFLLVFLFSCLIVRHFWTIRQSVTRVILLSVRYIPSTFAEPVHPVRPVRAESSTRWTGWSLRPSPNRCVENQVLTELAGHFDLRQTGPSIRPSPNRFMQNQVLAELAGRFDFPSKMIRWISRRQFINSIKDISVIPSTTVSWNFDCGAMWQWRLQHSSSPSLHHSSQHSIALSLIASLQQSGTYCNTTSAA